MKYFSKQGKSKALMATSALALAMASGFAQANPVTTWSYSTDTQFTPGTADFSGGGGGGTTTDSLYKLTWGQTGGDYHLGTQSALTVGSGTVGATRDDGGVGTPVNGLVNTTIGGSPNIFLGQIGLGTSLTHWNNPLSTTLATLTGAQITDTLTLTPILPPEYIGSPPVPAPTLLFNFKFLETLNNPASGICANGLPTPAGGCPDLFGFNGVTLNNSFTYADSGLDGILGNGDDFVRTYFASVFVLDDSGNAFPLQQLVAGECSILGLNPGCFGFRTPENAVTTAQFAFAITTEPIVIPEPGSLALMGLSLAALGALRQRRQRKQQQ